MQRGAIPAPKTAPDAKRTVPECRRQLRVKNGCGRQADGTAGLPPAPEMPVRSGTYASCQIRRLLLSLDRSGSAEKHLISADAHLAYFCLMVVSSRDRDLAVWPIATYPETSSEEWELDAHERLSRFTPCVDLVDGCTNFGLGGYGPRLCHQQRRGQHPRH